MGSVEIIEVLPLLKLLVEQPCVVDDHPVERSVELLIVDPVGSLDLAIEPWSGRLYVDVSDAPVQQVSVERPLKLGPTVRLNDLDLEGEVLMDVVENLDR